MFENLKEDDIVKVKDTSCNCPICREMVGKEVKVKDIRSTHVIISFKEQTLFLFENDIERIVKKKNHLPNELFQI